MKKNFYKIFLLALIIFLMIPGTSVFAGSASGLNPLSYIVQEGWKYLDTDVSVTSSSNNWTDGYVDIDITSGKDAGDQLRIMSSGLLSVAGDAVSWNGTRIGTIDPTHNGSNGRLRINFSASLLNSGFETGNFNGWTVNTSYVSADGRTHTQTATVQTAVKFEGSYAAKLEIYGVTTGYGVGHGPQITSSNFYAKAGDTLSVRWYAEKTQDYYDVYGYLVNSSTGVRQQLFSQRGDGTTGWTAQNSTISSSVCASGQTCPLQFQFLCGSYDATGGTVIGSIMYIDGISVVTSVATDAAVDYIVEHLEYRNTSNSPTMNKSYTLTLKDSSHTGTASSTITLAKANTSTSISGISPEPSVFGQNYSVSVSVAAQSPSSGTPVGSVLIGDGTNSCTATLSGGSGSCSLPSNSIGVKSISAAYQGSTGYNSSSTSSSHTINKVGTTTTITSDLPDPSVYGQNYTVAVSVAALAPGSGTPGGTVTVSDGTNNCPISLSGGSGSCTLPSSSAGGKTLTASYPESDYFLGSSDTESHTVNKTSTSTNVTRSVQNPVFGQLLSFNSIVSPVLPGTITPVGNVQFYIDGATFGNNVSLTSGSASSQSTTNLNAGSHNYQAKYEGDPNNHLSDSSVVTFSVAKNLTTTTVTTSSWPTSVYGQPIQIIATVAPVSPSVLTPVGQVQFYFEGSSIGSPVTLVNGVAQSADLHTLVPSSYLIANHIKVGSYSFSASYLGNSNSEGSVSSVGTQTIKAAATEVTIASSQNPSKYGTALVMTITVKQQNESLVTPTGTVKLYIDGVEFKPTLTLNSNGQVTRTIPYYNLWPGEHAITAYYTPTNPAQFLVSDNADGNEPLIQIVNKADASFAISSNVKDPVASEAVKLAVQLTHPTQALVIPTGTVKFFDGAVAISGEIVLDKDGKAVMPESVRFSAGEHEISVRYSGDEYFKSVLNSSPEVVKITKADTTTVILSASPLEAVVGQPVTVFVKVSVAEPGVETPAGSVVVSNGVNECTVTLDGSGGGSCQLVSTSPGDKTLTATYQGSTSHNSSTSTVFTNLKIHKATSSVNITGFSPAEPVLGEKVRIDFKVEPQFTGSVIPSGNVEIVENSISLCNTNVDQEGLGKCEVAFDHIGNITLLAEYAGDTNFYRDQSPAFTAINVEKAKTSLEISTSLTPSIYGQNVRFTADVSIDAPAAGNLTGSVQFQIDGNNFGSPVSLVNGKATSGWINTLAVGNHSISAKYLESDLFAASDVDTLTQVVDKANTKITLTSDQNPSQYGVPVLVTATVEGVSPSLLAPTSGTVQFIVDGVYYGAPVALNANGQASKLLPYTALWVGTHPITAIYSSDDTSFLGSNNHATPYDQVVEKGVGINLDYSFGESSPVFGQNFTVTSTLEADNINNPHPLPTGTIQFYVNGSTLGSAISIGESLTVTSNMISGLGVGLHALKVVYSGDDYYTSREVQTSISVVKSPSSVNITGFAPDNVVVGESVTVNFATAAATPGSGTPTGNVTVSFGVNSCSGELNAGSGSCVLKPLSSATGKISAAYQGDGNFTSSNISSVVNLVVDKASINLSITDNFTEQSYVVGQPYTVNVSVTSVNPGTTIPVGASITISNGRGESCNATIAQDGKATCQITPDAVEGQTLTASFAGNDDFNLASSSQVAGPTINKAGTSVSILSITPSPSVFEDNYEVKVQIVAVSPGAGIPSGSVTISDGTSQCSAPISTETGKGSCFLTPSIPGEFNITAQYVGDDNYNSSSTSQAATHTVNKAASTTAITASTPATSVYGANYLVEVAVTSETSATPTGTVTVGDGSNNCEISTLTAGVGSCYLPSTSIGAVTITAVYSGDTYLKSSQDTESHTIIKANTSLTISPITAEPSFYGQKYVVNVQVNSATSGVPTGTVTISDGYDSCQNVELDHGSASCSLTSLHVGDVTVSVSYGGDEFFFGTTKELTHTIVKANTTTTITDITRSPSVYGEKFVVTVEIDPTFTGTPTGIVTVSDGSAPTNECTINLSAANSCELMSSSASEIGKTITATYAGDINFNPSSITDEHLVNKATTSISLTSSTDGESVYGQPFKLIATVTQQEESEIKPTGAVQFYYQNGGDKVALGTSVTLAGGLAESEALHTLLMVHLPHGEYQFSAEYLGSTNFVASETTIFTQEIAPAKTTLTIETSEDPSEYGTSLEFTITVAQQVQSLVTPAGMVQLSIDGVKFMSPMVLDGEGKATRSVPYINLWPGKHDITAEFVPANLTHFEASTNKTTPLVQTVHKATPQFTIKSTVKNPVASQLVGFEVQVSHAIRAEVIPTGTVQFFVDGVALGDPVQLDSQGKAQSSEALRLDAGDYDISVSYSGDEYFQTVEESAAFKQSIAQADTIVEITNVEPLSVVVGQETTIFVKVSVVDPAMMMPYGKVEVNAGSESCDVTLNANGEGSCVIATDVTGEIEITAQYLGSEDHNASDVASYATMLSVVKANSAVSITGFSPEEPVVGQPVEIFFNVVPVAPGWGTPTGVVSITSGDTYQCQSELVVDEFDGSSKGSCKITFLNAANPVLKADYAGDDNFESSLLEGYSNLSVQKADTSLLLSSSTSPSVFGGTVKFTASIHVEAPGSGQPTGYVQFLMDGTNFGEPVLLTEGLAVSEEINTLVVGSHAIGVEYLGDDNFNNSSAADITQQVVKADSVLVLTSDQNPSPYGVSVLVTAQILGVDPSERIPTSGSVQFIVDGVPYGAPVPLNSEGKASKLLPYTALWVGTHPITAIYSGNGWFNGSNNLSNPWMQVVEKGDLTILVDYSVENPVVGQTFTISGVVVGDDINNPRLTGTLQFYVNDTLVGSTKTLDNSSSAKSDLVGGFVYGTQTIKLVYSGDDYYKAHTVETSIMVEKADTSVEITGLSSNSVVVGEKVTVNFSVDVLSPGIGEATGLVTISNGVDECSGNLTDGSGSCDLLPGFSDEMQLTAQYAGDGNFHTSATTQPYTGLSVEKASLSLEITDLPAGPFVIGQPYTISVLVSPVDPGTLLPVGAVVTISNGVDRCEAIVQLDGSAACEITPTTLAVPDFIASFAGDDNFNESQSEPVTGPTIIKADTHVSIASSLNPGVEGSEITFMAQINVVAPGSGNPGGTIQFLVDDEAYGVPVAIVGGKASLTTTDFELGIHAIQAIYQGSDLFNASSSVQLSQKIVAGNHAENVTPGEDTIITFHGTMNGLPVTTVINIPAGAVNEDVTVVYSQFDTTLLDKPEGMDFVTHFTLKVYKNGELVPGFEFLKPVQISMEYNPKDWDVESFQVMGWQSGEVKNGSEWTTDGIEIIENDYETNSIVFTLQNTTPEEFSLLGIHKYVYYFPVIKS